MLKVSETSIRNMEKRYPGITEQIQDFENMEIPPCPKCASADTARIQAGLVGRTFYIAMATTKFKLFPNYNGKGIYYCNSCNSQFGPKKCLCI